MVSVRKSRRTGAGRLVACQVCATQDCGQTPWAPTVYSERLGDDQKARIPRRAACPGSPACTAPRSTNCGLSGRHATYPGLIKGSLAACRGPRRAGISFRANPDRIRCEISGPDGSRRDRSPCRSWPMTDRRFRQRRSRTRSAVRESGSPLAPAMPQATLKPSACMPDGTNIEAWKKPV